MTPAPAPSPLPASAPFAAIVVAAGRGTRAGLDTPKQFAPWRGKPLLRHSVEALAAAGATPIVVVVPPGTEDTATDLLAPLPVIAVAGGASRQASVRAGLEALATSLPDTVLIHDAARPVVPATVIARLRAALGDRPAAIPVLPVVDSLAVADGDARAGSADRDALRRVQTPQAFRFDAILAAHRSWHGPDHAGDDAQVAAQAGLPVALVDGDEALRKLTFAQDFIQGPAMDDPPMLVGTGFDVHRLADGEELWLGGVHIPHPMGLAGHSDADVGIHAVVDAILGAIAAGDIGTHFPPSDPQWRGAASDRFLAHAVHLAEQAGYRVGNVDLTLICEAPKIGPHRAAIRARLAAILGVDERRVSLKATTTERLGFAGRGEGIAAQAVATLLRLS